MITIYTSQIQSGRMSRALIPHSTTRVSQPIGGAQSVLAYVRYVKGDETSADLLFSIVDSRIPGVYFRQSSLDGNNAVVATPMKLVTSGAYRIPIPVTPNEDFLTLEVDLPGSGSLDVWLIPSLPQI